jgi:hypothetical protein
MAKFVFNTEEDFCGVHGLWGVSVHIILQQAPTTVIIHHELKNVKGVQYAEDSATKKIKQN